MKIAYLQSQKTDTSGSGGAVHITQLANNLIKKNHALITNRVDESDAFIKFSRDNFVKKGHEINAFYVRIHGHPDNDQLTLFRTVNPHAPCIWEINAPLEELRVHNISEKRLNEYNSERKRLAREMVNGAICVSDEMETYARDALGIQNTCVIPNGSDPVLFSPKKPDNTIFDGAKFVVLWVGSSEYKWQGHELVLQVANALEKTHPDILFALTAKGISSANILFLDKIPYSELPVYLSSADIGLCLYEPITFFDSFFFSPLKMYDYMASGLPVVGINEGQVRKTIETYECGDAVEGSINAITHAILRIKNNMSLAEKMGINGRKAVVQCHNWKKIAEETALFIGKIINNATNTNFAGKAPQQVQLPPVKPREFLNHVLKYFR